MTSTTKSTSTSNPNPTLGFNTLLLGAPGAGKTTAIPTLAKAGLEVFVAFTEQGVGNLKKAMDVHNLSEEERARIHWAYISPTRTSFSALIKGAKDISRASEFGKMPAGDRKNFTQFIDLLNLATEFVDQNGESFGAVDEWDSSRVFVIDGLSGLNDMAMSLVAGDKPVKTLQDWGVAIDTLDKLLKMSVNSDCGFVLLSHLEQEKDEVTGRMTVTASTLGRKLGTTIGRHFQDVILADSDKGYQWSTDDSRTALKHSFLPRKAKQDADFIPLVDNWKKEG